MKKVTVHAELLSRRASDPDDAKVPGDYPVEIFDEVPDNMLAGVALDIFHSCVAVGCLDDFEFNVTNEQGDKLEEPENHVDYSGADKGYLA
jgi:hypothetical protein